MDDRGSERRRPGPCQSSGQARTHRCRLEQGKTDKAIEDLEESAKLMPLGIVNIHLARAQVKKWQRDQAIKSFNAAMRMKFRPEELHELERPTFTKLKSDLGI